MAVDAGAASVGIKAPVVSAENIGLQWGQGQNFKGSVGDPFESYIGQSSSAVGDQLPTNSQTFDFFNDQTGLATSAKTLDTGATSYQSPSQITSKLNSYIDQVADYPTKTAFQSVAPADIQSKAIQLAVPASTNSAQWSAIQQAVQTAAGKGIQMTVTVIK